MTTNSAAVRRKLVAAADARSLVRIERRPRYGEPVDGFVVGVGHKWALVATTIDGGYFDGHTAIRVRDIHRVRRDRSFQGTFSRTQPGWPPAPPGVVDLDSTKAMLRTFAATAPLIAIEKEHERRAMWVGEVVGMEKRWVRLREVRPDGTWHRRRLWYELRAVTKASVGTHYLTGLAAVLTTMSGAGQVPDKWERRTSALANAIRLGYEAELDDPDAGFEVPPDDEIRWLAAWLVSEGWRTSDE
jgi:hypothetical protein